MCTVMRSSDLLGGGRRWRRLRMARRCGRRLHGLGFRRRRRIGGGRGAGWVVERTFAWLHQFKRLLVRYDRRADIHGSLPRDRVLPCLLQEAANVCERSLSRARVSPEPD